MTDKLIERFREKAAGLSVLWEFKDGKVPGDMSWPGMLDQPKRSGREMVEFIAEQYAKVGLSIGDPKAFWDASPTGELSHVSEAYQNARMIYEAERELATP